MKTLFRSLKFTLLFCILLFVGYVGVLCGFAAVVRNNCGEAELVRLNNQVIGAANVGQSFTHATYFWGRPSAVEYDGGASGGSNKGASNPEYLQGVQARIDTFLALHPYLNKNEIPSELVTFSGSGLDPHISPYAAETQIRRVATARSLAENSVREVVMEQIRCPLVGQPYINVLELNVALDRIANH